MAIYTEHPSPSGTKHHIHGRRILVLMNAPLPKFSVAIGCVETSARPRVAVRQRPLFHRLGKHVCAGSFAGSELVAECAVAPDGTGVRPMVQGLAQLTPTFPASGGIGEALSILYPWVDLGPVCKAIVCCFLSEILVVHVYLMLTFAIVVILR